MYDNFLLETCHWWIEERSLHLIDSNIDFYLHRFEHLPILLLVSHDHESRKSGQRRDHGENWHFVQRTKAHQKRCEPLVCIFDPQDSFRFADFSALHRSKYSSVALYLAYLALHRLRELLAILWVEQGKRARNCQWDYFLPDTVQSRTAQQPCRAQSCYPMWQHHHSTHELLAHPQHDSHSSCFF